MSGRRLRNCSHCKQRHYAPSGAKCPHAPEDVFPLATHPELEDDDSVDIELAALDALDDCPPTPQTPPTPETAEESDVEIPSGQPDPPTPPRDAHDAVQPPSQQVTIQQFAEDTNDRVQQLELEKTQLTQAHAELQARQDNLQASLDALQRQLGLVVLQPNQDVRQRHQPPAAQPTEPKQRRVRPPPVGRVLTQPPANGAASHEREGRMPVFQLPSQPIQQQPTPMMPILPPVRQAARPELPLWIQQTHVSLPTAPGQVSLPATLTDLRTDRQLMDQAARTVSINTQESTESGKPPKSGFKRDNAEHVQLVIPWPHEHVLRHNAKPPTYESLSLSEFATGNMRIMAANAHNTTLVRQMADYLAELFDDTTDTDWPAARFAHRVVLQAMENGRLDYSCTQELRQMRTMALNRATRRPTATPAATTTNRQRNWSNNPAGGWSNPSGNTQPKRACNAYQKGDCPQSKNHQSAQGYVWHACAYCLATVGRAYNHTEAECRRKASAKEPKNEEPGSDA